MPETEEEKKKRWARNAAKAYMTPAMAHAMAMSKYQSQNKYKEQFNKSRGKGYTTVTSTPELEHVKKQSVRISQNKYKSEFEKNKAKFTQVADDPETQRVKRVTNQVSKVAYAGKGSAMAASRRRKEEKKEPEIRRDEEMPPDDVPPSYGRPAEVEETIEEETEPAASDLEERTNGDYQYESSAKENQAEEPEQIAEAQAEDNGYEAERSYGREVPEENGDQEVASHSYGEGEPMQYTEADIDTQQGSYASGENNNEQEEPPQEAQAGEEEVLHEISEGGLDDFYANLG